jgi:hypothetical protein
MPECKTLRTHREVRRASLARGAFRCELSGAEGDRTPDLMTASHALSQLSYGPGKRERDLGTRDAGWRVVSVPGR